MSRINKTFVRNVTILAGSSLSVLAATILAPALPTMLAVFEQVPNSELLVRLVLTTPALFIAIGAPVSGFLLDRLGRKPVLLVGLIVYSLAGSAGFFLGSIYGILISRAILGLSISAIMSGFTTLIIDYFEGRELDRFMGYQSAFISFGGMSWLFLGGILADIGWRLVFLIHLIAVFIFVASALTINEPSRKRTSGQERASGAKSAVPYKKIGLIYLTTFISITVFFIFPLQIPFYLASASDIKSSLVGLALSIQGFAGAIVALQYMRLKKFLSFPQIFIMIFIFFGINHLILSQTDGYGYLVVALAVGGLGIGLLPANVNVWLASVVPGDVRGRAVGGLTMSLFFGQFLTPIITQPFLGALGFRGMFFSFAIIAFIAAAVFSFVSLANRRKES
ncbi:MAG TPA: MFS transporter [Actinobacteria bacterium]|nr:MFS transporter [Actinomycetota bacterium]